VDFLCLGVEVVLNHHERWDGGGYGQGLVGEAIPIAARIFALVDVFDALMSKRPYKPPFSYEDSREIIRQGSGGHFDPNIVEVFLAIPRSEVEGIRREVQQQGVHTLVRSATNVLFEGGYFQACSGGEL